MPEGRRAPVGMGRFALGVTLMAMAMALTACSNPVVGPTRPTTGCGQVVDSSTQTAYPAPTAAAKSYVDAEVKAYRDRVRDDRSSGPMGQTGQPQTPGTTTSGGGAGPLNPSRAAEALKSAAGDIANPQNALLGIVQSSIRDRELVVNGRVTRSEMYAADSREAGSLWATQGPDGWRIVGTTHPCESDLATSTSP